MGIKLLTRADDFGSSHAANMAIYQAVTEGDFIRNVSVMAPGPMIEEAAQMVSSCGNVCFGMHAVVNAEWDLIKWPPILPGEKVPHLTDPSGAFAASPGLTAKNGASAEEIIGEYEAQLDYLTRLGVPVVYADEHMFPSGYIDGLAEAFHDWTVKKGLINHIYYYRMPRPAEPARGENLETAESNLREWVQRLEEGLYFSVMHPARYSREMLLCRNSSVSGDAVARNRDLEYQLLAQKIADRICDEQNICRVRYDQAEPVTNGLAQLKEVFGI